MAEISNRAPTAEGLTNDLKAIQSRIEELSKEVKDGIELVDSSVEAREKILEYCASQYPEVMKMLECQDSDVEFVEYLGKSTPPLKRCIKEKKLNIDPYMDNLMKEIRSVEEETTRMTLEIDQIMDTYATASRQMETDLEECGYMLQYVDNEGGQSGELNSSQMSSFQHQEFEIQELDRQIEESAWRLKVMQDLDNALTSVDTLTEASSTLSAVKVLEVKDNCVRLFLSGPVFTSDGLLMGQKLDLSIEKPVNSDHELLIEFTEGNMELKKMEIFPDDVPLSETFDMIKSSCRDFHLGSASYLRYVVQLVQRQIILCTAKRLLLKEANKSRHSFDHSARDKMVTVHLVGGIDAFIEVPLNWPLSSAPLVLISFKNSSESKNLTLPLVGRVKARANSLEHPRHHLVRFADAIEEILVQEMQSEI